MKLPIYILIWFAFTSVISAYGSSRWPKVNAQVDSIMEALDLSRHQGNEAQLSLIDKLAASSELPVVQWRTAFWHAHYAMMRGQRSEAQAQISKAREMVDRRKYEYDSRRIDFLNNLITNTAGTSPLKRYIGCHEAAEYFSQIGDHGIAADGHNYMGILLCQLGDDLLALESFKRAQSSFELASSPDAIKGLSLNMADCYLHLNQIDSAQIILKNLEKDPWVQEQEIFYINVLLSLTETYRPKISPERSLYDAKLRHMRNRSDNPELRIHCDISEAIKCIDSLDYTTAKDFLSNALSSEIILSFPTPQIVDIYKNLALCFYKLEKPDSALKYYTKYAVLNDSIKSANPLSSMQNHITHNRILQFDNQLRLEKAKQTTLIWFFVAVIAVIVVVMVILVFRHKQIKLMHNLKEAEKHELELRIENDQRRLHEQQLEIELRNRQLMERTLVITEKDNALKGIKKALSDDSELKNRQALHGVIAELGTHIDNERQWESFQKSFEEINPSFYTRLVAAAPNITEGEKRLCAYLLIGMPRKQIANMLNVQPDSVKKAINRLRKKLDIPETTNLTEYLSSI